MSEGSSRRSVPRVSLTKSQVQSALGVELLSLCQTITQDGRLDESELRLLQDWLDARQAESLPSISYLTATVKQVLSTGSITDEQLCSVYRAIEKILPPDVRETARSARQKLEIAERAKLDLERPTVKASPDDGWTDQNYFDFMVAGVRHENRAVIIADHVTPETRIALVRDHRNAFSPNAIEIRIQTGEQIGFVPELDARELAPLLDRGATYEARIKKILTYGRCPIPVVIVQVIDAAGAPVSGNKPRVRGGQDVPVQEKQAFGWRRWFGWN